jgi:hypothetical protein
MARPPIPESERFWRHVEIHGPDECWLWTAYRIKTGYGTCLFRGKTTTAHRVAVILSGRELPDGLSALHSCDNPPCCNPAHIFVGLQVDNLIDMREKGREFKFPRYRGEDHGRCVVTDKQVTEIRVAYRMDNLSQCELARRYGISQTHVSRIIRGENR